MPAYIDLTNQRFGRLIAIKDVGRHGSSALWLCRCDCGNELAVSSIYLRQGDTKSCGCLKHTNPSRRTHGMSWGQNRSPEYITWCLMRKRCTNPNDARYEDYGGRGIKICERWDTFENFLADMGPRRRGHSIERINVDGDYEPSNCKWIPLNEQSKNRRHKTHCKKGHELSPDNVRLFHDGKYLHRHCLKCIALRTKP